MKSQELHTNKRWLNGVGPLRLKPNSSAPLIMNIPERAVVDSESEQIGIYERVTYRTDQQNYTGWVYVGYLEDYLESMPKDCVDIPDQTSDPRDAEQYFMLNGIKQTNICGPACIAYILDKGVKEILENWKQRKPASWLSVLGKGKLRGTGYGELMDLFTLHEIKSQSLTDVLRDKVIGRSRYTVTGLQSAVDLGSVIAAVHIDYAGRLKPSGTPHWVVVTDVQPERAGYGLVEIYNPFPNRIEIYSWNEFVTSARAPSGVFAEYKFS